MNRRPCQVPKILLSANFVGPTYTVYEKYTIYQEGYVLFEFLTMCTHCTMLYCTNYTFFEDFLIFTLSIYSLPHLRY